MTRDLNRRRLTETKEKLNISVEEVRKIVDTL